MLWSFRFSSGSWVVTLPSGTAQDWSISLNIDLNVRADTGKINNSPITLFAPDLKLIRGCYNTIEIPGECVNFEVKNIKMCFSNKLFQT